jgi:hypothetical protein
MIRNNELKRILSRIEGNRVYVDPVFYPAIASSIRILPLITKKTLIYANTQNNKQGFRLEESLDLINENMVVPVAISEEHLHQDIAAKHAILRNNLFDESLFSIEYAEAIQKDHEDELLIDLINKQTFLSGDALRNHYNDMIYSLNWNLLLSQVIKTPVLAKPEMKQILSYKCKHIVNSSFLPNRLNHAEDIKNFIQSINPVLPANLDTDKIKAFRKEKIAIKFQNWLERSLSEVYDKQKYSEIAIDDYLIKEFNELSRSYVKKPDLIAYPFGALLGGLAGVAISKSIAGGVIGSTLGASLGIPFSSVFSKVWKKHGPEPWIFILNDMR